MKSEILITMGMVWPVSSGKMESCLHGGGGPQRGEVPVCPYNVSF